MSDYVCVLVCEYSEVQRLSDWCGCLLVGGWVGLRDTGWSIAVGGVRCVGALKYKRWAIAVRLSVLGALSDTRLAVVVDVSLLAIGWVLWGIQGEGLVWVWVCWRVSDGCVTREMSYWRECAGLWLSNFTRCFRMLLQIRIVSLIYMININTHKHNNTWFI